MEHLSELFYSYPISYVILFLFSYFYPYIAKGNIPYTDEEYPDAALLVAWVEGMLVSEGIAVILAVLWSKVYTVPLDIGIVWVFALIILNLTWRLKDGFPYGTKITWLGVMSYARRRYSWIINRIAK